MHIAYFQRHTVVSSMACLALRHFSTLSHKRQDYRKNVLNKKYVDLIFYTNLSEIFLILSRTQRDIIIIVQRSTY